MTQIACAVADGLIVGVLVTLGGAPFWAAFGFGYLTYIVVRSTQLAALAR